MKREDEARRWRSQFVVTKQPRVSDPDELEQRFLKLQRYDNRQSMRLIARIAVVVILVIGVLRFSEGSRFSGRVVEKNLTYERDDSTLARMQWYPNPWER